uniref:Acyl-CoA oxidase like n=1 Tax=Mandrillus leucophaeus TaxID=9568 RepID=A0A2K5YLS3_MANLE
MYTCAMLVCCTHQLVSTHQLVIYIRYNSQCNPSPLPPPHDRPRCVMFPFPSPSDLFVQFPPMTEKMRCLVFCSCDSLLRMMISSCIHVPTKDTNSSFFMAAYRRQFGPKTKEEVKIVEHQTQTLWLMPPLATALALTFVSRYTGALVDEDVFQGKELVNSHSLQALVAALKAYSTWENICCLQDCRKCMVVGRELLAQYTKQYEEKPLFGLLQNWAESVGDKLRTSFLAFNMDTVDDLAFLLKAVKFRERVLQWGLVTRIYYKTKKEDFFHAWNSCLHHVASLSLAHTHRVTLEQFSLAVKSCPDQEDQTLLMKFCLLYGTKLVFQERAWYLEHKYLTPVASLRIRNQLLDVCDSGKDDALRVIPAFNIPHTNLHAPIAGISNPRFAWAFYPAPLQPLPREGARSQRPKLGAKL